MSKQGFENLMYSVFDKNGLSEQPNIIVIDDISSNYAKTILRKVCFESKRSENLTGYPLTIVSLAKTDKILSDVWPEGVFVHACNTPIENLSLLDIITQHSQSTSRSKSLIIDATFSSADSVNQWLTLSARQGLIPEAGQISEALSGQTQSKFRICAQLTKRDISVRPAVKKDLRELIELEEQCWANGMQMPTEILEQRLHHFPEGQLVIQSAKAVIGVVYTQRISDTAQLDNISSFDVQELHQPQASTVQLLALNILPSEQHHGYGDQLLEFLLQLSVFMPNVAEVVGVTKCKDYQQNTNTPLSEYIQLRNPQGRLIDTVLRFHELHGAKIERLVQGYRPADSINQGCGVLVSYDIYQRKRKELSGKNNSQQGNSLRINSKKELEKIILDNIAIAANITISAQINTNQPLFELGIDSAALLDLSERLSEKFNITLKASFFFEHNTASKISAYLQEDHLQLGSDVIDTSTKNHVSAKIESKDDIAIIGVSCLLPGGINHYDIFWELLEKGGDAVNSLPAGRWQWPDSIDAEHEHKGINLGGFAQDIDKFDAKFFRISPREAELMDPQHRLLLEHTWTCLEDAGYSKSSLEGTRTGVYVGASGSDYQLRMIEQQEEISAHFGLSTSNAVLANRISYFFDWTGPSLLVDTACSSSLVALTEAVTSLRAGKCEQALVAGVNILCHPSNSIAYYKAGMLAKDGRCKTFDAKANGYVRSEGLVSMLIKPLCRAIEDGDDIRAVIKGVASNHGGQAAGLTVPNPAQQAELVSTAIKDARTCPENISYIEAHGTGTGLGDPIEIDGLKRVFHDNATKTPCGLGSVKTNIGHLEATAGLAGLLKVVLSLQNKKIPASRHFNTLNPEIDLSGSPLHVIDGLENWNPIDSSQTLQAGVSSFGSGGANAHVIVESFHSENSAANTELPVMLVLSAKTEKQLRTQILQLHGVLSKSSWELSALQDIAYTLQIGREAFKKRFSIMGKNSDELIQQLDIFLQEKNPTPIRTVDTTPSIPQVEQWIGNKDWASILHHWKSGGEFDWTELYSSLNIATGQASLRRISLPTYPFDRKPYWKLKPELNTATPKENPILLSEKIEQQKVNSTQQTLVIGEKIRFLPPHDFPENYQHGAKSKPRTIVLQPIAASAEKLSPIAPVETPQKTKSPVQTVEQKPAMKNAVPISQISETLIESLANILFLETSDIDSEEPFTYLGLDSISGVEWMRTLNRIFSLKLTATTIYSYPSISKLAEYIATQFETANTSCLSKEEAKSPRQELPLTVRNPQKKSTAEDSVKQIKISLCETLAEVLFLSEDEIDTDEPFTYLGLDSISGVEFIRAINRAFNLNISATVIYSYPSVNNLSNHLAYLIEDTKTKQQEPEKQLSKKSPEKEIDQSKPVNERSAVSKKTPSIENSGKTSDIHSDRTHTATPVKTKQSSTSENNNYTDIKIAIVGMAGQYPEAPDLSQYWQNLIEGRDSVQEIPNERWNIGDFYDERPFQTGKTNSKWLGMLSDLDSFDADFFGITKTEAEEMDPQQRLFLQEAYHAIENSGYSPESLAESSCGVYLGVSNNEYATLLRQSPLGAADRIGNNLGIAAARIAYHLDLQGPAIAVDTACSSSLVAIHLACQALRCKEIDMALAGGACTYLTPELYIGMSVSGMLAPDGRCKTFDDSADGIVPGEGVGAVYLKRLDDAEADGDNILGVVVGSGINQDGKTNGITAPSGKSQAALIRKVYDTFNIDAGSINYIETHGTGTKLGDPIELDALAQAFKKDTNKKQYCLLGSVKSNLGHTSAASGIAGLHKTLLSLQHQKIPKSLHFKKANTHFNFQDSPFSVNTKTQGWTPQPGSPRRAAISSFGISGTNAHIVVEEYTRKSQQHSIQQDSTIFVCTGNSEENLRANLSAIKDYISRTPDLSINDICHTLQIGRDHKVHRIAIVIDSTEELSEAIRLYLSGSENNNTVHHKSTASTLPDIFDSHDLKSVINDWLKSKDYLKICRLWANGIDIDWSSFPQTTHARKIQLPGYVFSKSRFWIPEKDESNTHIITHDKITHKNIKGSEQTPITNVSTKITQAQHRDIYNTEYNTEYNIDPPIDEAILVASVVRKYLDFNNDACFDLSSIELTNYQWERQHIPNEKLTININLMGATQTPEFQCLQTQKSCKIISGQIVRQTINSALQHPLHDVLARCNDRVITHDGFYRELSHHHLQVSEIDRVHTGDNEVLLRICPKGDPCSPKRVVAVIRAFFHCTDFFVTDRNLSVNSVERICFYHTPPKNAWIWINRDKEFDDKSPITNGYICDDKGVVCIAFIGVKHQLPITPKNIFKPLQDSYDFKNCAYQLVLDSVSKVINVPSKHLDLDIELGDQGFDSIRFTRLAAQLNSDLNTAITPVTFFQYPSIRKLAEHLLKKHPDCFMAIPIKKQVQEPSENESPINDRSSETLQEENLKTNSPEDCSKSPYLEDIAVIGLSGCFPGATDIETFWKNLQDGKDSISEIPQERWNWQDYWGDPKTENNKTNVKWAGFADELTNFDPSFFGISPRDAELMDVQQRALLVYVWKAIEDAGYSATSLAGSQTGIVVGTGGGGFGRRVDTQNPEASSMLGMIPSIGPNRISHLLDIHGPSEPIETSCSSSLVAIHRSISLLRTGGCDMVITGGVNVLATPEPFCSLSKAGILSIDGRCKTFSKDANGYARGEGIGILILKRLSDAEKDGDQIYALLRGSAQNHGGRAQSLTAPNPTAQTALLKQAYSNAGIDPSSVGYIEAHGTGTALGDPIETQALKDAFTTDFLTSLPLGTSAPASAPASAPTCGIGSVKSNIGHLELASGVAGVIKVLLQLKHKVLVKSLHSEQLNPLLKLENSAFYVVQKNQPWHPIKNADGLTLPRRAGVSSFGFGGVNAHVILEEYQGKNRQPNTISQKKSPIVIVLSAKTETALLQRAQQIQLFSQSVEVDRADDELLNLAYTLQIGRDAMRYRLAFLADSMNQIRQKILGYINGNLDGLLTAKVTAISEDNLHSPISIDMTERSNPQTLLNLAEHWIQGAHIEWASLYHTLPKRMHLPSYPFEGHNYLPPLPRRNDQQLAAQDISDKKDIEKNTETKIETNTESGVAWENCRCFLPTWDVYQPKTLSLDSEAESRKSKNTLVIGDTFGYPSIDNILGKIHSFSLATDNDLDYILQHINKNNSLDHIIWLLPSGRSSSVEDKNIVTDQNIGVKAGLKIIQSLLKNDYTNRDLEWTVITVNAQAVHQDDNIETSHASVHGLIGTMAKEHSNWRVRLIDIDMPKKIEWQELLSLAPDRRGRSQALRRGEWYQKQLVPVSNWRSKAKSFRQHGVYVIVGGAGDVGVYMTEYLIKRYSAHVIWLGRRELNTEIESKLISLDTGTLRPQYIQTDASDEDALATAYQQIKMQHSEIHGVIHAAMVFSTNTIANISQQQLDNTLKSKIDSSVNLARVFNRERLDFVLYFSSLITFIKNPRQSHYAAACEFKDVFAQKMSNQWSCTSKVVNWGYWSTPDLTASEDYEQLKSVGIDFITPTEGMALIETLLSSQVQQLGFMKTNRPLPVEGAIDSEAITLDINSDDSVSQREDTVEFQAQQVGVSELRHALSADRRLLDSLLSEYLYAQLAAIGLFSSPQETLIKQAKSIGLLEKLDRWLEESLSVLTQQRWINISPEGYCTQLKQPSTVKDAQNQWNRQKSLWMKDPAMKSRVLLVEPVLEALPKILAGKIRSTDILFPKSSMELVGNVYKYNRVASYFNESLADAIVAYLKNVITKNLTDKIRILEIGAGTGGTTTSILSKLKPYHQNIAEYCYTDISKAFLSHAETVFGPENPFLTYRLFNVDKSLSSQNIDLGQYDIVIAANVLHATENIRRTLTNAKAVLKPNGILVLNEVSQNSLFMHLTFGLTDGWWLYDDPELRISGSPALSPKSWEYVLRNVGFCSLNYVTESAHDLGQQVIMATSDGIIRQKNPTKNKDKKSKRPTLINSTTNKGSQTGKNKLARSGLSQVQKIIIDNIHRLLKVQTEDVEMDIPFFEFGIDSITGVNLVNELNKIWDSELETTVLFDYSTVKKLSLHICEEYPEVANLLAEPEELIKEESSPVSNSPQSNSPADDPIAIIGMSGRFAQSENVEELWQHLLNGDDLITPVTRWDLDAHTKDLDQSTLCKHGSFLSDIDGFDPMFFNISGVEARAMDPQQRFFLQEAWHALEDSGYAGESIKGKECGVYVGCMGGDYRDLVEKNAPAQAMWGNSPAILPARIAYYLDLKGPAISIDTACSSSLVAMHLACQSLRAGETEMALAGGVYIQSTPRFYVTANRAAMLSPSGRCHTFDKNADGFVPGEGVAVVVLKRMSDAIKDGDHVYGIIRGSGVNQDGATNGITAPSALSQEQLYRKVYHDYKIKAEDIQMMEAHGTGTPLGDPIEYQALTKAFSADNNKAAYCALGSIKTNIGHTTHAAGIAGVIKILMSLKHKKIPASLNFKCGNNNIRFDGSPFYVNTALKDWENSFEKPRLGAVSSFGISGTNAHLVLEESPNLLPSNNNWPAYLIFLSAKTEQQLQQQAVQLKEHIDKNRFINLEDISFTLIVGRQHFEHRFSCSVFNVDDLNEQLDNFINHRPSSYCAQSIETSGIHDKDDEIVTMTIENWSKDCNTEEFNKRLHILVKAYCDGIDFDIASVFSEGLWKRTPLPTYPFSKDSYWIQNSPPIEDCSETDSETSIDSLLEQVLGDDMEVSSIADKIKNMLVS